MTAILATLDPVRYDPSRIVSQTLYVHGEEIPDDSGVVRGARPMDDTARAAIREQQIARLLRDST